MSSPRDRVLNLFEQVGKRRTNPVVRAGASAARAFLRGFDYRKAALQDMEGNGEFALLDKLGSELRVVFDVGANVGDWTAHALKAGAQSVHAFEISPATSEALAKRYADEPRVCVNTFGLSNESSTVTIHHYPEHPVLTSMTDYPQEYESVELEVPVKAGDDYLAEAGIDTVDFLKMDVEGAEQFVVEGFRKAFERKAIRAVQFEYTRAALYSKYFLRDFYADMTSHGFLVGRIRPEGVSFVPFELSMERFNDSNWLAVHADHAALIERVRLPRA